MHARTHTHGANYNLPPASRAGDNNIVQIKTTNNQNNIRYAHTPQPREILFNTMRHGISETVQRSGCFQNKQHKLCEGPNNVSTENNFYHRKFQ